MFAKIQQDLGRCGATGPMRLKNAIMLPGMWAVFGYRFRRWLHASRLPAIARWPLKLVAIPLKLLAEITSNVEIPNSADVGPGLFVPHTGYVVIGTQAVIGRHCTITQGVTVGHARGGSGGKSGSPVIGDRVYLGPGSAVIGPISIGDDALIGVGAVVVRSVPPRAVVVGNPARVIALSGSFEMIHYPGMESDPARRLSLEARDVEAGHAAHFAPHKSPLAADLSS